MDLARHHSALLLSSIVTVASFLAVTAYTQHQLVRLDEVSSTLETNSVPSIEYLARSGVRLRRVRELLVDIVELNRAGPDAIAASRAELRALREDFRLYARLTPLPGERDLWIRLRRDVEQAVSAAAETLGAVDARDASRADALLAGSVDPAFDAAARSLLAALDFDVRASERLAHEVREVRAATRDTIIALDAGATAVSLLAVVFAFRASRRHDRLQEAHRALLAERVSELDRFAGRVAHDIVSPLGAITFSLGAIERAGERSPREIQRAQRAVDRVKQIVDALLAFARAGARADSGSRCELAAVLANVRADCAGPAAAAGIELTIDAPPGLELACAVGVGTSILENLVRNAIKYMDSGPARRIAVRAGRRGALVRIEVEDSGPGIAPDQQSRIFEPFERGGRADDGGVGLGLATVKRLVEAHGGTVVVRSRRGAGSTFCVELPAPPAAAS
jgi:signal transduction histidine kinase